MDERKKKMDQNIPQDKQDTIKDSPTFVLSLEGKSVRVHCQSWKLSQSEAEGKEKKKKAYGHTMMMWRNHK